MKHVHPVLKVSLLIMTAMFILVVVLIINGVLGDIERVPFDMVYIGIPLSAVNFILGLRNVRVFDDETDEDNHDWARIHFIGSCIVLLIALIATVIIYGT